MATMLARVETRGYVIVQFAQKRRQTFSTFPGHYERHAELRVSSRAIFSFDLFTSVSPRSFTSLGRAAHRHISKARALHLSSLAVPCTTRHSILVIGSLQCAPKDLLYLFRAPFCSSVPHVLGRLDVGKELEDAIANADNTNN